MSETIRAADALARRLAAAGVQYAFGMPGGEVLTVVDALRAAGIRFILAKHENAATFMAEAAWHRTGAPGVVVATVGPGVLNGMNAVANAFQDRVPLIFIAGAIDPDEAARYTHQVVDQTALFGPVTKASFTLHPGAAHTIADKAVAIATEGRPGPVHLDVPISVAVAPVPAEAPPYRAAAAPMVPEASVLTAVRGWLAEAERPIILAGVDAMNEGAEGPLREAAERLNIPVLTSYKAKGLVPEDWELALGGAGLSPLADRSLVPLFEKADLVVAAGYDPIEMRPGWRDPWHGERQRVIDITAEPNHHYMHQSTLNLIGSTPATLAALFDGVSPRPVWPDGEIAAAKAELARAFPADEDWGPGAIVDVCRTVLPRNTLATADSGAHRILLSQQWHCYEPRGLMQSSALCTMGCALPLAIGGALTAPDRPVVSFSGDAGFLMVAGELSTAAELGVKPIFIVFVDASLALIELKQRQRQLPNAGVDFARHDFAAIGRAFGGNGVTVHDRDGLTSALKKALDAETFTVIACEIDREAYDGRI